MITHPPFNDPIFFHHPMWIRSAADDAKSLEKAKTNPCLNLEQVYFYDNYESRLMLKAYSMVCINVGGRYKPDFDRAIKEWFPSVFNLGMSCYEAETLIAHHVVEVLGPHFNRLQERDARSERQHELDRRIAPEYRLAIVRQLLPDPAAFDQALAWTSNPQRKSLLLVGPTGTGKTRTAYQILASRFVEQNSGFADWSSNEFKKVVVARSFEAPDSKRGIQSFMFELCREPTVFLDDLTQAKFSAAYAENLYELIETRTSCHRPMIITSQLEGRALIARLAGANGEFQETSECLERRLRDFFEIVRFRQAKASGNRVPTRAAAVAP